MPASSSKSITEIDDIPTLHDLYASDDISSVESEDGAEEQYKSNEALNRRVSIWRGDITVLKAGMIVNAANSSLLGGGGVDGAIHRAAGRQLYAECKGLEGAETGETKVTGAYDLPSTYIAHTVGPVYSSSHPEESREALESCYRTSLEHCKDKKAESIGFSSISTGIYGYPINDATHVALRQTRQFLEADDWIKRVIYVVFSAKDEKVYRSLAPIYFPPPSSPIVATTGTEPLNDGTSTIVPAESDATTGDIAPVESTEAATIADTKVAEES